MQLFGRAQRIGRASVTALAAFVLFNVVAHAAIGAGQPPGSDSNPGFAIASTISSSSTSQIPALLFPGTRLYLWYNVTNPNSAPITVNSIGISAVNAPAGCSITNLQFNLTTFTGALVVPAHGTNSVPVPISLYDTNTNQDSCEGVTFNFTYSGTATYTEVYATSTLVTSSLDPSALGQAVTYTATVTASATSDQDPVPSSPTGSLTFMQDAVAIPSCSDVAIISTSLTTAQATCITFAYATSGSYDITANFTNTDGNFSNSSSTVFSQVVS